MQRLNRPFSFPSLNRRPLILHRVGRSGHGVAILILMMILTILLISLTVALPNVYTEGKREREEELIFRGNEYARAIMLYHRQFNKFPTSVKDLLKRTNGYRFLRHPYKDPMTLSGNWRFIHANAAGVVLDSKTLTPPGVKKPGQNGQSAGNPEEISTSGGGNLPSQTSNFGNSNNQMKGAFIVGVASTSTEKSIRILDKHDRYDEWEFLGIATTPTGPAGAQTGTPATNGQPAAQSPGLQNPGMNPTNPQP